jgi:predicted transcriptional regulator
MIGIASLGFLIIQQYYENRINELKNENESIDTNQRDASDFIQKSISSRLDYALFKDNLDLFKIVSTDVNKVKEKEKNLIFTSANSAMFALDASIAAKKIDQNTYNSETEKVRKTNNYNIHKEYYLKYIEIAGKGTMELDELRKQKVKKINDLSFWKDTLWYFFFLIQSLGLSLAIIAIMKKDIKTKSK